MGKYLDRLNEQFDDITTGVEEILNRAADENRDVTKDEAELVERENKKADELKKSIDHYSSIEKTRSDVEIARSKLPTTISAPKRQTTQVIERETKPEELIPTAGDYITTVARAMRGDKAAAELIQRATEHQTTADNPGIIPNPILGPVVTAVSNSRPFIQSITNKRLPTNKFSRPVITQHVAVGIQDAEKTLTESRKLLITPLDVQASTYAGHLNVSRQDIKWSQPGIMQILAEDFGHEYAVTTDEDAVGQFLDSLTIDPIAVADNTGAAVRSALFAAAAQLIGDSQGAPLPDTLWASPDVWGDLGSMSTENGLPVFPNVVPTATGGNPMGLKLVVDPWFPPGTAVVGVSSFAEWYEDIDGLITVSEPDVLGQLVGYAGYGAFLNTRPDLFVPLTLPTVDTPAVEKASTKASSSK